MTVAKYLHQKEKMTASGQSLNNLEQTVRGPPWQILKNPYLQHENGAEERVQELTVRMAKLQRRLASQARHLSYTKVRTLIGKTGTLRLGAGISGKIHLITFNPKIP